MLQSLFMERVHTNIGGIHLHLQISDIGTIIVPDLPGMGDSSHFKNMILIYSCNSLTVMGEEKIENKNIYLIGHSLWWTFGCLFNFRKTRTIKGIIIIDSSIHHQIMIIQNILIQVPFKAHKIL